MAKRNILVTGGAGYIGSHAVLALLEAGWTVTVYDNLCTGNRRYVPAGVPLVEADIRDTIALTQAMRDHDVAAVMHFAGSVIVPESLVDPLKYYSNNAQGTLSVTQACVAAGVDMLVYSSTAAVYGMPERMPVDEAASTLPVTPYGWSKLMGEQIIRDAGRASGLRHVLLRYFNVAGSDPQMRTGQPRRPTSHLIKAACEAARGMRPHLEVFGTDWPTRDGSCVRDFIHVTDLADLHVRALERLAGGGASALYNCGSGTGWSVRQVIAAMEKVTGRKLPVVEGPRREGDLADVVAADALVRRELDWSPRHSDLETIIATSLAWEERLDAALAT